MEVCLIAPTDLLETFCTGRKVQMCLAHRVLEDEDYRDFYREQAEKKGITVIMDNSMWELGMPMELENLYEACALIDPLELILPDAFGSSDDTIMMTEQFLGSANVHNGLPWSYNFVVPHGKDREDWIKCFDYFNNQEYAHVIGIPKILDDMWLPGGRLGALMFLERTGRIKQDREYHCLGIRTDPIEILLLSQFSWIRSLDTALPLHAGIRGIQFDADFGLSRKRPKRPDKYFDITMKDIHQYRAIINRNIDLTLKWSRGEY